MGVESTELTGQPWMAMDAGATRVRVAPFVFSDKPQRAGPVVQAQFASQEGQDRVQLAAQLAQSVAQSLGWQDHYHLGLAWAGAPGPDRLGTIEARYGPAIPDLVPSLCRLLPLANQPLLHSDASAAVEGAALQYGFSSAYALISGSGLGEAYYERGQSWPRECFLGRLGRACEWHLSGQDGESWLRASSWRFEEPGPYLEALRRLVEHRLQTVQPEVILLGGHFRDWFERAWFTPELALDWWFRPAIWLEPDCALSGCVQMEARRLKALVQGQ